MRLLILVVFLSSSSCLRMKNKELMFPSIYASSFHGRANENFRLEELDGKCINKNITLSFDETDEAIFTLYVNGNEVKKGHVLKDGLHEIKFHMYRNGLVRTKAISVKIEKER